MLGINTITITPKLLLQVSKIDHFNGLWTGLDKHTTGLHLLGDVADHGENFKRILGPLKEKPLSTELIRGLHAIEMKQKGLSDYRTTPHPLDIEKDGEVIGTLETAYPVDITPLLEKLCEWTNAELSGETVSGEKLSSDMSTSDEARLHPLIVTAIFTSVFLQISPFEDGNIKTVRFLMLLLLLKSGYTYTPYVSLSTLMNKDISAFYNALKHNQESLESGKPDWSNWLSYFMELLDTQAQTLYDRLYNQEAELQNLPELSSKIMSLFKTNQRLQMNEIIRLTNGRRATIKLRLSELLEAGYLRRYGKGRATWYALV